MCDRGQTVLVVDDEPSILVMMRALLMDAGCTVITAQHGEEALARAVETSPDLIITDLMMPVMDGHELRRRLKEEPSTAHIPVLLMTVVDRRPVGDSYAGVIVKPFAYDDLVASIRVHLS